MKLLNFPLAKWASNSEQLKAIWRAEGQEIETQTQLLGVNWNTETECFFIDPETITNKLPEGPTTKRKLLQTSARFYDPLGLYSPVSVVGKLLFPDTWRRGIDWNELLPPDLEGAVARLGSHLILIVTGAHPPMDSHLERKLPSPRLLRRL
jgi:hypothetical protein